MTKTTNPIHILMTIMAETRLARFKEEKMLGKLCQRAYNDWLKERDYDDNSPESTVCDYVLAETEEERMDGEWLHTADEMIQFCKEWVEVEEEEQAEIRRVGRYSKLEWGY